MFYLGASLTGIAVIGFIVAAIFLRKVKETLFILYEFKIVGITFLIWMVALFVTTFLVPNEYYNYVTKYYTGERCHTLLTYKMWDLSCSSLKRR